MMYDLVCVASLKHDIEVARRQAWDVKHMRGPAIEADIDWRIPLILSWRKAVRGDIWPTKDCDVPGSLRH